MYSEELRSKCGVPEPLCIVRNSAANAEYRSHAAIVYGKREM